MGNERGAKTFLKWFLLLLFVESYSYFSLLPFLKDVHTSLLILTHFLHRNYNICNCFNYFSLVHHLSNILKAGSIKGRKFFMWVAQSLVHFFNSIYIFKKKWKHCTSRIWKIHGNVFLNVSRCQCAEARDNCISLVFFFFLFSRMSKHK